MAAQSSMFSIDASAEKEPDFEGQNPSIWYWHLGRHCDHNWLHWEGQCDQQLDQFLKLMLPLQVSPVTQRSPPVVVVSKICAVSWSGWFRTGLFRALCLSLRLTFRGKRFTILQTLIFTVIIPHTSLYGVCRRLIVGSVHVTRSDATSNKTLTLFSANFAFHILLCVWISMFIQEKKKLQRKEKSKSTKISVQQTTNG